MEKNKVELSIIVPVYNVEPYIRKCLDSILQQTCKEFELLLIDDGSTDNSGSICEEYASRDSRITVIHQSNRGLSAARNAGLELARGKYIGFVDSDDSIRKEMYERLLYILQSNQADMSVCSVFERKEADPWKEEEAGGDTQIFCCPGRELVDGLIQEDWQIRLVLASNKLYKKSLFRSIRYPEGKIHEDEFVIHRLLFEAKKVAFTQAQLYGYLKREDGITGNMANRLKRDKLEALWDRTLFLKEKGTKEQYQKAYGYYLMSTIWKCKGIRGCYPGAKEFIRKEKKLFRRAFCFEKRKSLSWKYFLKFHIFYLSPRLYFCMFERNRKRSETI